MKEIRIKRTPSGSKNLVGDIRLMNRIEALNRSDCRSCSDYSKLAERVKKIYEALDPSGKLIMRSVK